MKKFLIIAIRYFWDVDMNIERSKKDRQNVVLRGYAKIRGHE
jgi:hypothetical protein